jgi:hypothetical protein
LQLVGRLEVFLSLAAGGFELVSQLVGARLGSPDDLFKTAR